MTVALALCAAGPAVQAQAAPTPCDQATLKLTADQATLTRDKQAAATVCTPGY